MQKCNTSKIRVENYLCIGGGTAGHIHPLQAIASQKDAHKHYQQWHLLTDHRALKFAKKFDSVHVSPVKRRNPIFLMKAFLSAFILLWKIRPKMIFASGGYVALMPILAAKILRIPMFVIEVNAVEGRVNKISKKLAKMAFSTFPLKGYKQVGFMVRSEFQSSKAAPLNAPKSPDTITILVMGSSIGTELFAKIIPQAIVRFSQQKMPSKLHVIHQAPAHLHQNLQETYNQSNITATISDFFINIHEHMTSADLVISRAGASAIAELYVLDKKMLLIPFAAAADNHQVANAKVLNAPYLQENELSSDILLEQINIILERPTNYTEISKQGAENVWKALETLA